MIYTKSIYAYRSVIKNDKIFITEKILSCFWSFVSSVCSLDNYFVLVQARTSNQGCRSTKQRENKIIPAMRAEQFLGRERGRGGGGWKAMVDIKKWLQVIFNWQVRLVSLIQSETPPIRSGSPVFLFPKQCPLLTPTPNSPVTRPISLTHTQSALSLKSLTILNIWTFMKLRFFFKKILYTNLHNIQTIKHILNMHMTIFRWKNFVVSTMWFVSNFRLGGN